MQRGTTIVELTVSIAILAVVFASLMPVFAGVRHHADAAGAASEMVQNARIVNDQLSRHLAGARRITAVSGSSDDDGYIEFETSAGVAQRCELGSNRYVEFGPAGGLSELAGPVESLTFTCYDGNDPAAQTDEPDDIRLVTWEARLDNAHAPTGDRTIRGVCYLRVGTGGVTGSESGSTYDFSTGWPWGNCFAFCGAGKPQVPGMAMTPTDWLTWPQYDAIKAQDGNLCMVDVHDESEYAQMRFVFQIAESRDEVSRISATWRGKGVNDHHARTDGARLYIWDYAANKYELLQASASTESLVTLTGIRTETPSRYVDPWGWRCVVLFVVSNDKKTGHSDNELYTDYVRLDVGGTSSGGVLP